MTEFANDSVKLVAPHGDQALQDKFDLQRWLIYCPAIASDTLLLFITQGESYSLRSYGGHLGVNAVGSHAENAHTTSSFREMYKPETVTSVDHLETAVHKTDKWEKVIADRWSDYRRKYLAAE